MARALVQALLSHHETMPNDLCPLQRLTPPEARDVRPSRPAFAPQPRPPSHVGAPHLSFRRFLHSLYMFDIDS